MHIPDGYLSPATCAVAGAAMVPVIGAACAKTKEVVKDRHAPLLALGAAYSFLVMMLNIPIPGGTTAHAVGAVLIAVLLGPWAATVCVSVALVIQALFFGDGGVLALGANTFNMAFVMPFVGYGVYRLLTRNTSLISKRRALAAGIGSYVGLNAAALCAAIEFGLQPTLFHSTNGTPLYAPFHLSQTIPAMALAHLTIAGAAELLLSAGVVAYLQRANLPLLRINHSGIVDTDAELAPGSGRPALRWALIGIATMIVLSPLGLLAPGGAYGEDAPVDLNLHRYGLSAIPSGLQHYNGFWKHTLLADYGFSSGSHANLGYVLSAILGALAVGAAIFLFIGGARLVGRRRPSAQTG
jgi:cobalt/nickel transport system permease protein